ncbi:hypothetical protein [Corynebacterium minutissimum]|uniref:Uncharacterized protein n=1 Tax=Corynebacterium minutissimum TaxID=38301 RepID=A0A2X4RDE4_9CORY|nr:hypothetical protein [Corynebacterium minutissimum]MCG7229673.1 hypothetical protein [Corynebacterium minutissimum]MCG7238812.1 hypothetical protein [Corynebacterium minutissimum]QPS58971.1 hypothetical protein I6G51_08545 [Corynebacterium minutissimum]QQA80239.1 hypothetical protein I6H49_04315 [Corynebacterium minutissimum]SQH99883.1 Uncharacterised protein [Corynebacterium minutissimum]
MAVKPHDPRAVLAPEALDASVAEILQEPANSLEEELNQLDRVHAVLRDALQDN